ncbi:MAG: SirB1 family protein [Betaproteobacteria bacterium]|nr:tetratricopeptide repeat protein [Betaproteobacteria bacterium]
MSPSGREAGSSEARAAQEWRRIAAMRDEDVSLAEGALWIAAGEYPGLEIGEYLARIDALALTLRKRLRADIATAEKLLALNHYLFDELGFSGNGDDYYDPRNSFLNDVLERRLGIPITLAVVYIEIGRRIGIGLHGVSFPGHFLVKCALRDGMVVLDPYARGRSLDVEELQQRLRAAGAPADVDASILGHLLSASPCKEILGRMLRNLKGIYAKQGDWLRALAACERAIALRPEDAGEEYRDRAGIYLKLECFRAALGDLGTYLRQRPGADDAAQVRARITELQPLVERMN